MEVAAAELRPPVDAGPELVVGPDEEGRVSGPREGGDGLARRVAAVEAAGKRAAADADDLGPGRAVGRDGRVEDAPEGGVVARAVVGADEDDDGVGPLRASRSPNRPPVVGERAPEERRGGVVRRAEAWAGKKGETLANFGGSYLDRFPLDLAHFWTSDHLSGRTQSVDAFFLESFREHPS